MKSMNLILIFLFLLSFGSDGYCKETASEILRKEGIDQILFIKRFTFQSTHYYSDFIDGPVFWGTDLCVLDLKTGNVRSLIPELKKGIVNRCDLSFDGKKVVFDYKRAPGEGFRIWEVGIDGSGLRPLTFPPADEQDRIKRYKMDWSKYYMHHTDDLHPCWLSDGGIVFVSSRCEHSILCDGSDYLTTTVLYRMDKDGKKMEKLSENALSEATPSISEDGRIVYTRWEYVDNGAVSNKGLWLVRPDGTGSEELYGANIEYPPVHYAPRAVPGTNHLFVCVGTPHMPLAVGPIILVDSRKNRRTGDPMQYITPEVEVRHQWGWDHFPNDRIKPIQAPYTDHPPFHTDYQWDGKGNTEKGPLFADPYPISSDLFMVSYNPDQLWNEKNAYSLYLIDGEGMRLPIYRDETISCWGPIPVVERPVPPMIHGTIDQKLAKDDLAQVIITNVYQGLDGVKEGTIKYIRVNEHVARPWSARRWWSALDPKKKNYDDFDQQHSMISKKTHLGLKVQHGIVPVEKDGSANFYVKADRNIFFQVLDENYMEVQRERTFTNFRPGEIRSCIGCHETAADASSAIQRKYQYPLAMKRSPVFPGPQPGEIAGEKPLHYPTDVQPVLDKYCVHCHSGADPQGGLNLTGEATERFSRSYEELIDRKVFPIIGENHPKMGNNHYLPPYTLGSHASSLIKRILDPKSPCFVKMSLEDRIRLTTWVDGNGQFYGTYFGPKSLHYKDLPDFRRNPTFEETQISVPPNGFWKIPEEKKEEKAGK